MIVWNRYVDENLERIAEVTGLISKEDLSQKLEKDMKTADHLRDLAPNKDEQAYWDAYGDALFGVLCELGVPVNSR